MDQKKQVLSCIQPTGNMHFGNYFGAVKNWVKLQENYDCIYGVVDYHAMTMPYNPKKLRENTWELVFNLIATGIKPESIFIQSLIPEHAELCWIFNCFTSYGHLGRMTQFKVIVYVNAFVSVVFHEPLFLSTVKDEMNPIMNNSFIHSKMLYLY